MANLFATKPLKTILDEAHETGEHSLRRALGPTNLITLGIGAIIGTGIFVITGTATAEHAGPAIILSFIFAALGCVFAGLCYAEFASLIPVAGSAYTYGYATLGEIFAWIIGWDLVLEYAFGAATVASGWSGYLISLLGDFGIKLPASLAGTRWDEFIYYDNHWEPVKLLMPKLAKAGIDPASLPHTFGTFNLFGFLAILLATVILIIGIKESANFNSGIVIVKVCVLIIFVAIGANYLMKHPGLTAANWHPFIPAEQRLLRAVWLVRHIAGSRHHFLCLHRIRRSIYRRPGSERSRQGHANRHSGIAGHLHHPLYSGGSRADRAGSISQS